MTAFVLLVKDSLLPYVTSVPMHISVTCVSLHSLRPRLSISAWMRLFQDVPWERLLPPGFPFIIISFDYNSFEAKFHPTCPGVGCGTAKLLVRLTYILTLLWH